MIKNGICSFQYCHVIGEFRIKSGFFTHLLNKLTASFLPFLRIGFVYAAFQSGQSTFYRIHLCFDFSGLFITFFKLIAPLRLFFFDFIDGILTSLLRSPFFFKLLLILLAVYFIFTRFCSPVFLIPLFLKFTLSFLRPVHCPKSGHMHQSLGTYSVYFLFFFRKLVIIDFIMLIIVYFILLFIVCFICFNLLFFLVQTVSDYFHGSIIGIARTAKTSFKVFRVLFPGLIKEVAAGHLENLSRMPRLGKVYHLNHKLQNFQACFFFSCVYACNICKKGSCGTMEFLILPGIIQFTLYNNLVECPKHLIIAFSNPSGILHFLNKSILFQKLFAKLFL